jgi:phytoene/squalene synthetase
MRDATAALARSITRAGSKQAYYTARLLVDKDLVDDSCRAYAYLRWVDDVVDGSSLSDDERISFVRRQRALIDRLRRNESQDDLTAEEEILATLMSHDRGENSGLQSFICSMFAIIEFDAYRKGRLISHQELTWYSDCVGRAVTEGSQYFIGNGHAYPESDNRYRASIAAHITHMLRDMLQDIADGFINVPREYLEAHGIGPIEVDSPPFRAWVRSRVQQARQYFSEGKRYLDRLDVLRCKMAGHWYCARFEGVLDTIERDDYILRAAHKERWKLSAWLKIARLSVSITFRHVARPPSGLFATRRHD